MISLGELERAPCDLCGSEDLERLLPCDYFGLPIPTVQCRRCSLVFFSPRPQPTWYATFYKSHYRRLYTHQAVDTIDDRYLRWRGEWDRAHWRIAILRQFLGTAPRVLDIGCGLGVFLAALRSTFPSGYFLGIEPDAKYASFARNEFKLDVRQQTLEDFRHDPSFTHAVALHVMEHVPSPKAFLERVHSFLGHDDCLIVEVPNLHGEWRGLSMFHVAHTHCFSSLTLRYYLESTGFHVVHLQQIEHRASPVAVLVVAKRGQPRELELHPRMAAAERKLTRELIAARIRHPRWSVARARTRVWLSDLLGPERFAGLVRQVKPGYQS